MNSSTSKVDFSKCTGIDACKACVRVCPVNIFDEESDRPSIIVENEDECTLCGLCKQACSMIRMQRMATNTTTLALTTARSKLNP